MLRAVLIAPLVFLQPVTVPVAARAGRVLLSLALVALVLVGFHAPDAFAQAQPARNYPAPFADEGAATGQIPSRPSPIIEGKTLPWVNPPPLPPMPKIDPPQPPIIEDPEDPDIDAEKKNALLKICKVMIPNVKKGCYSHIKNDPKNIGPDADQYCINTSPPGGVCAGGSIPLDQPDPPGCVCTPDTPAPAAPPPPGDQQSAGKLPADLPTCPPGSPPAKVRFAVTFDGSGSNPPQPVNITWNNRLIPEGSDSFLEGMIPLIWARNSILDQSTTVTRTGSGGSLRARVGVSGFPRCEQIRGEFERNRAELQGPYAYPVPWDDGKSYWVGFSINPTNLKGVWTLFQVHAPVNNKSEHPGGGSNSLTIMPRTDANGNMSWELRVADGQLAKTANCALCNTVSLKSGPLPKGQWTDFVMNYTLSSKGQGYVRLWVNGQKLVDRTGLDNTPHLDANGQEVGPNRFGIVPRVGIYGPDCSQEGGAAFREAYFDNFRDAVGCDGYKLVDPSDGRGSPPGGGGGTKTCIPGPTDPPPPLSECSKDGVPETPPPAVGDGAVPGSISRSDHRIRMLMDPDMLFSQHRDAQWVSGSNFVASGSGMFQDIPATGLLVDSKHRSLERVRDPRTCQKPVFRFTISDKYPYYNNKTTRITSGSPTYSLDYGPGKEVWCAHSFIPHKSFFSTPWTMSVSGYHHVSWGRNSGFSGLTPWTLFMQPVTVGSTARWILRPRTTTTVNADGTWTPGDLNDSSKLRERSLPFGVVRGDGEEHKIVINFRTGYLKSQNPKMIVWHKVDGIWSNGGNPVVQDFGPIGYNLADQSMQLRGVGVYNWTSNSGNYANKWPAVNNIPFPGEAGMRAWSRGSVCLVAQPPRPGEPELSPEVLMKWLER